MREFIGMFKELYFGTIDMWKNDRKEFWVVFVFWISFWVILPIIGN